MPSTQQLLDAYDIKRGHDGLYMGSTRGEHAEYHELYFDTPDGSERATTDEHALIFIQQENERWLKDHYAGCFGDGDE